MPPVPPPLTLRREQTRSKHPDHAPRRVAVLGVKRVTAGPTASPTTPAGWLPDPTGRHQLRYWSSSVWTEHVSDDGVAAVDPA
ncbi:MAG: DUF2510 domain-containing protein [Coriobacteriia bacterium]|nr:DUF2510 domain-containing protein [Coriobacteriia bacterium]